MPAYDYSCKKCQAVFEVRHGMMEAPKVKCQECGSRATQKMISTGIVGKNGNAEAWDYADIRKYNPKYLKSKDGKTRVKYDPTKHGGKKGAGR